MATSSSVTQYLVRADGSVRLALAVAGPFPDTIANVFSGVGGTVTPTKNGVTVTWDWAAAMAPADPVGVCTQHIDTEVQQWAARWAPGGVVDLR